jgi:hypothetical protein
VSYSDFPSAPQLKAQAGQVFDTTKSSAGVNVQQELKGSASVTADSKKDMARMNEFADQMKQRAQANGGEPSVGKGREATGLVMQEGLSYGAVFAASLINPALGMGVAAMAGLNTVKTLQANMNKNSTFTAPEDIGKGSKADAKANANDEIAYKSSGGSETSLQSVAQNSFQDGAMMPSMMPAYHEDKPQYSDGYFASAAEYDKMYDGMVADGSSPEDIYTMAMNLDKNLDYQALQRQIHQHDVVRPQNLHAVAASGPSGMA